MPNNDKPDVVAILTELIDRDPKSHRLYLTRVQEYDSDTTEPRLGLEGRNLLLLAMCRHKLGQTKEASAQLQQACKMMQKPGPIRPDTGEWAWLIFQIQYKEAKTLFPNAEWPSTLPLDG